MPKIKHVFVIVLENENADVTFGPDGPEYLRRTLTAKGTFLSNYFATGHLSLDNYISMVSGQGPNVQTQADCMIFSDFKPGIATTNGQVIGQGCVYPASVQTIADQLEDAGKGWHGYMEDMAAAAPEEPATCRHPAIGAMDDTQSAEVGDQYATRHNPFMYFHSIIDDAASCNANDVDYSQLDKDLKRRRTTSEYNFITPNLCNDGHDEPCVDGEPGGLESANAWLREAVPMILRSPAYNRHGLLIITFDEAEAIGSTADASACCNEQAGPNTPNPGGPTPGPGGGRIGAVLLSPCIHKGSVSDVPYNHYSFLRWAEDNFGLGHLGFAAQKGLEPFGTDVFNRGDCHERIHLERQGKVPRRGERGPFRFRVHSRYRRCRKGVTIRLAGKRAKTNRRGRATIRTTLGRRSLARASKRGCRPDRLRVRVRG